MRTLKEYISYFDNISLYSANHSNLWQSEFNQFLKTNQDNPNYEYLIGIKDYLSGDQDKNFIFLLEDQNEIKGYAAITLKKIVQDMKIKSVCYINEIIVTKDYSRDAKHKWENIFIKIIEHKDEIIELRECEFFYTLSLGDSIEDNTSFKRLKRAVKKSNEEQFKIFNIFTKNYLQTSVPQYSLNISESSEIEISYNFILEQKLKKSRDLNTIPEIEEIKKAIIDERLFNIKDFATGQIIAVCLCEKTKLKKEYFHKLDGKFKLSSSLLPLMGRGQSIMTNDSMDEFNNLYIKLIEIKADFLPRKKTEIVKNIICNLFKIKDFKDTLIFTIPSFDDLSIENAMKSFFCVETNLREITFNDFEDLAHDPKCRAQNELFLFKREC